MTTKATLLLTLILAICFASCNKATPAAFWKGYQKEFLVKNISDQGPYGGHRAIYWKAAKRNTFTSSSILDFANKNGWTLADSSEYSEEQIINWKNYNKEAIFPLTSVGFSDTVIQSSELDYFPRWFGGKVKLYKFKTGVITIEPGTNEYIEENGFVLVNNNRAEMAAYHLWGE